MHARRFWRKTWMMRTQDYHNKKSKKAFALLGLCTVLTIILALLLSSMDAEAQEILCLTKEIHKQNTQIWQQEAQALAKSKIAAFVSVSQFQRTVTELPQGISYLFVGLDYEFAKVYHGKDEYLDFGLEIVSEGEVKIEEVCQAADKDKPRCRKTTYISGDVLCGAEHCKKMLYVYGWRTKFWRLFRINAKQKGSYALAPKAFIR